MKNSTSAHISRRWQAPGAVNKEKKFKKIRKRIKKIVPVPLYVFVDSDQKAEFKATCAMIKSCSHQLNCMNFYRKFIYDILEGCKISNKFNESFLSYG